MRKFSDHLAGRDVDDDFCSLATGVDVWGIVVSVVHEDDDTIEATDDRHSATV